MEIETNKYRIVDDKSQTIEENLSIEEANYLLDFLRFDRGINHLKIVEYFPFGNLMGRDPDLH